jgi:putative endopeptidase
VTIDTGRAPGRLASLPPPSPFLGDTRTRALSRTNCKDLPMRLPRLTPLALALGIVVTSIALAKTNQSGIDRKNFDTAVAACEDFYQYANGSWTKNNPVPSDRSVWGLFDELEERSRNVQRDILQDVARSRPANGTVRQQLGDFYATGMDEAAIEKAGHDPIKPDLARIAALESATDVVAFVRENAAKGQTYLYGVATLGDMQNSDIEIAYVVGAGLGLPDRDYYTRTDDASKKQQDAYREHIKKTLMLVGTPDADATRQADETYAIEDRLARVSMTRLQMRDFGNFYRPVPVSAADALTPGFDWDEYMKALKLGHLDSFSYSTPAYFSELGFMLKEVPIEQWRAYLTYHTVDNAAPYLSKAFVDQNFDFFSRTLRGQAEQQPRWQRVLDTISESMGEGIGQLYVERTFSPEAKTKALALVTNLQAALKDRLQNLEWMGEETREQALAKFATFTPKIGYPDKWLDYSAMAIDRSHYYNNVRAAQAFENARQMAQAGKPIDKDEWGMPPQQVNAYYNPQKNEIAFPAAILQPPFFDPDADDALNYGAIGGVIGHELLHGYDDQGSKFDANGNYRMWWTDQDRANFEARAQKLIDQAGEFVALRNFQNGNSTENLKVNGALTLGENIADLGGLTIAYEALQKALAQNPQPPIDGMSADQRFFLGWAQGWRRNYKDELKMRLTTDVHAPSKFRTNGPLSNMESFHTAFECETGDAMVRPDDTRVRIW